MTALHSPVLAVSEAVCHPAPAIGKTYFFLTGDAECGLLPRVLQSFAKLGLTPYRVHASAEQGAGQEMSVELRIAGADPELAKRLASLCRTIIGVRSVIMTVDR